MKKVISLAIVLALLLGLLVPTAAYAKDRDWRPGAGNAGEKYAIVIGVSNYPGDGTVLDYPPGPDLFYADDDAQTVAGILINVYGFKPKNVKLLVDEQATSIAIHTQIALLKRTVKKNDEVFFFFSGHAFRPEELYKVFRADEMALPFGDRNHTGIAVWKNTSRNSRMDIIWDFELKRAFSGFETDNIIFVFDSCSSAGFSELADEGRIVIGATDEDGISGEIGEAYADMYGAFLPEEYLFLLYANQGLFTYFFFAMGIGAGYADGSVDGNFDGAVTLLEAYTFAYGPLYGITLMAQSMGLPLDEIPVLIGGTGDFIP
jgi:hypothetical protein